MAKNESAFTHPIFAIILLGILYLLFPSINPSGDTYTFANQIKNGNELFLPHHLIYNAFYYVLSQVLSISDTLSFISFMNGIFAIGCLFFMNAILSKYTSNATRFFTILFLGSCFGFMRYATTGETYIVPLFFSLWASWCAITKKPVILTALIAGVSCLFHQIHIFWWLGLLIFSTISNYEKQWKNFLLYCLGSCIVPFTYLMVFYLTEHDATNLFEYIAYDYIHNEDVEFTIKTKALILTPINFIRTFYQVHGYIILLVQKYWFVGIGICLSVLFGIFGLIKLRKIKKRTNTKFFEIQFAFCHLLIFFLQLLFAAISDGNAEFMVMLPFALALFALIRYTFQHIPMYAFALSILIWNISVGLIPYHILETTSDPALARYIKAHPDEVYYIKDRQIARESLKYHYPDRSFQLYTIKENTTDLDSLLQEYSGLLSDILTQKATSRSSMIEAELPTSSYNIQKIDSVNYDLGALVIARIEK
jgi:hypothetical protein